MGLTLPDVYTGVAFNAEPFDIGAVPIWADLSSRYVGTGQASRGRSQYELSQGQTGTADMTWYDQDEALNPQNPSSPYAGLLVPYRALLWRTMWPVGGTGNLIAGSNASTKADGSFESYTSTSDMQQWFSYLNGATSTDVFTLVSAGAWQGTKAAQIVNAASASVLCGGQGSVNLIPGRTYTAQAHIQQSLANAFHLAIGNQTICVDPFTRTTASGWGTPPTTIGLGPTWTIVGTAANFSTAAGTAFHSLSAVNARLTSLTGLSGNIATFDSSAWATFSVPVIATGATIVTGMVGRYVDANNFYQALLSFGTDQSVTASLVKVVAGVTTVIASVTLPDPYAAGDPYRMHFDIIGTSLSLKVWRYANTAIEPVQPTVTATDSALTVPASIGVTSFLSTGNTNTLPVLVSVKDFRSIGSTVDTVNGVTSTSGAYVLLKQTFVATQPFHTIQLENRAPNGATQTVLVDGIQVEPGSTANTFTTSGPSIRSPWTRGFVERWPAQWDADSSGFLGVASTPVVGPGAILNNVVLHAEYRGSVMAKQPRYYWMLAEPQGATTFGDQSGYNGPVLQRFDGSSGAAPTFTAGTRTAIAGDPNGVGLLIDGVDGSHPFAATLLTTGYRVGQPIAVGANGAGWAISLSCWAMTTDTAGTTTGEVVTVYNLSKPNANTIFYGASFGFDIGDVLAVQGPSAGISIPVGASSGGSNSTPRGSKTFTDGLYHHFVATFSLLANAYTINMYVDGTLYGTVSGTASTDFGSSTLDGRMNAIDVMGDLKAPPVSFPAVAGLNGVTSHIGVFTRALLASEVADLYQAGLGYPNENSGSRVARYVALTGYGNPNIGRTDIAQGSTLMGVSTLTEGTTGLSAIQNVQDTEFGNFFEGAEGPAFRGRQARYLTVSSSYTLGENAAGGEYPYSSAPVYDLDPTYVFSSAAITRSGGIVAYAFDQSGLSQLRFGSGRQFTRTINNNNDNEAQDAANYVVATSSQARPRVASVVISSSTRGLTTSDGTLWLMGLALEIGMRVTQVRRAKAANAGAGLTITGDFFIEAITPTNIDIEAGTWDWELLMSPVPPVSAGGQPWILENATYGVLDSTTILGF